MTKRCKVCGNYLTVAPGQPCPTCYTVSKPSKKTNNYVAPQAVQYYNGYGNGVPNYYGNSFGYPAYTGQYSPPPTVYGGGYNSPQPQVAPPTAFYSNGYGRPKPQAPPMAYGGGYTYTPPTVYNNGYDVSPPLVPSSYDQQAPQAHDKKRAVLCGVTYKGHKKELEASINNVRSMHQLLPKMGFPLASILILTEEETDPARIPTKRNIQMALQWLTKGCKSGDSLVFYYAGHGSHVADKDGDEKDGFDEALCPVDYRTAGMLLDDEINATLVVPLPHGVTLHSIIDTCFSGTLLDLPFLCRMNPEGYYKWEDQYLSHTSSYNGTRGGKAICISACDDHQNSADTSAFTGTAIGALTYSFIQAVQSERKPTYGDLLEAMRKKVYEAQKLQGINAAFASSLSQEPQLSCSSRFEIYSEPFML